VIDAVSGLCCGDGIIADASGRCCAVGKVDACGVCGGAGVAVDINGVCCNSALPASGACCTAASGIDSCGVCGGRNECGAVVNSALQSTASSRRLSSGSAVNMTNSEAAAAIASALHVSSAYVSVVTFVVREALLLTVCAGAGMIGFVCV
jgi:hypothetical protein